MQRSRKRTKVSSPANATSQSLLENDHGQEPKPWEHPDFPKAIWENLKHIQQFMEQATSLISLIEKLEDGYKTVGTGLSHVITITSSLQKAVEILKTSGKNTKKLELQSAVLDSKIKECQTVVEQSKQTKAIIDEVATKVKLHETEIKGFVRKVQADDSRARRNNVVIYGLRPPKNESIVKFTSNYIETKLKVKPVITAVKSLGSSTLKLAPILVTLGSLADKSSIFKNCSNLRGENVSIQDDLSIDERKERLSLMPLLKKLKLEGNKVYFRGTDLYVNGVKHV